MKIIFVFCLFGKVKWNALIDSLKYVKNDSYKGVQDYRCKICILLRVVNLIYIVIIFQIKNSIIPNSL